VTSYFGPELRKYTSYRGHAHANPMLSTENAVRQVMVNDRGVISLSAKSLHFAIRRGLAQWNIQSVNPLAERIFGCGGYLMLEGHWLIIIALGMINSRIFQQWRTQIEGRRRSWLVVVSTQCLQ
jgi:hypothetical protein